MNQVILQKNPENSGFYKKYFKVILDLKLNIYC